MNPTFQDMQSRLPFAEFVRLQAILMDSGVKRYKRRVYEVLRMPMGEGKCGKIAYEPVKGGKYEDPGFIKTGFLTDRIAFEVCKVAKEFKGRECILFQRNVDHCDAQPNGYRELVWIQVVEDPK